MQYRADIDGLRAIAVVSVVLFHAGFSTFSGGFVGVDIFFVLSGFLITTIIWRDIQAKQFTFKNFYQRRIRRIFPAYLAMLLVTAIVAVKILTPNDLEDYADSLIASIFSISNFYFAGEMSYFQDAAEELPLLHTWSLSVEEQFYVIWPVALLVIAATPLKKLLLPLVALFIVMSIGITEWAIQNKSKTMVFFFTPFRIWELMMGAILAFIPLSKLNITGRNILSFAGLLAILVPVFLYDKSSPLFPGFSAVWPCLGTALIIYAGGGLASNHQQPLVNRLLSLQALTFTGLVSYSWYLWHWPVFAFDRYLQGAPEPTHALVLIIASYVVAILSWRFIEQPFRYVRAQAKPQPHIDSAEEPHKNYSFNRRPITYALVTIVLFAGVGWMLQDGLPKRADKRAVAASEAMISEYHLTDQCLRQRRDEETINDRPECVLFEDSNNLNQPKVALWGDSHANSYAPAVEEFAKNNNAALHLMMMQACKTYFRVEQTKESVGRSDRACEKFNKNTLQVLQDSNIDTVIIAGYYGSVFMAEHGLEDRTATEAVEEIQNYLANLIVKPLVKAGKHVVLLGQPPIFPNGGGRCLAKRAFLGSGLANCDTDINYQQKTAALNNNALADIAENQPNVTYVDPATVFCDEYRCTPYPQKVFAFRDKHHLNVAGAHLITRLLQEELDISKP